MMGRPGLGQSHVWVDPGWVNEVYGSTRVGSMTYMSEPGSGQWLINPGQPGSGQRVILTGQPGSGQEAKIMTRVMRMGHGSQL